jgi:hypothetical protein
MKVSAAEILAPAMTKFQNLFYRVLSRKHSRVTYTKGHAAHKIRVPGQQNRHQYSLLCIDIVTQGKRMKKPDGPVNRYRNKLSA